MSHWLLDRLATFGGATALVCADRETTYDRLVEGIVAWDARLRELDINAGDTVAAIGDASAEFCSLLFALAFRRTIVVPLTSVAGGNVAQLLETANVDGAFIVDLDGAWRFEARRSGPMHPLAEQLQRRGHAGLLVFTSGSTGTSKACLLDFEQLFERVRNPRARYVTLVFLLLDHIGGINTLLNALGNGGTAVVVSDRSPEAVCRAVAQWRVGFLPASPTFLRMLLMSDAQRRYDLSSLQLITYGTEPMPQSTLNALSAAFPNVRIKQEYGLSETGIIATRSRSGDSLWMKLGSESGYRVVDGVLWLKCPAAMLGYLNAAPPFDADGWLNTHDRVEVEGEYLRVLGRESDTINVGGEKVHPTEVEAVLLECENVADVTVYARSNPVTGQVVVARVSLVVPETAESVRRRLRARCLERLEEYKVPVKVEIVGQQQASPRFKKLRPSADDGRAS